MRSISISQRNNSRTISTSGVLKGMEEFFPRENIADGKPLHRVGRPWTAAELRLKSFDDLHKLWFVCLKERNLVLSDRLYLKQIGQAVADTSRLSKVKLTMARIKVVLGERARAQKMLQVATAAKEFLSKTDEEKAKAATELTNRIIENGKRKKIPTVTYKKFGRSYTVPEHLAPSTPTRQQKKVAHKRAIFFRNVRNRREQIEQVEKDVYERPRQTVSKE